MRVKSRSIYTVLNGGCYPDQLRRKGTVAWGNADARFSSHWVGADLAVLRSDDRQSSTRAGSLGSVTRSLIVKFLKPVFAGRRIATQSWAIFGIRRASLTAQCTTMAPPSAASDHFRTGESKNDGMGSSDQTTGSESRLRRRHFRGGSRFAQVCRRPSRNGPQLLGFSALD